MSLIVSDLTKQLLKKRQLTPILVLEIEGFDKVYSSAVIDYPHECWVDVKKSTNNFTQQLNQERGGVSSVGLMKIRVVDKDQSVTRDVSPNFKVVDPLSLKATVSLMLDGGSYPNDRIVMLNGVISKISIGAGYVNFFISHPEELKRQKIFIPHSAELVGDIDNSVLSIDVDDASGFTASQDALTLYAQIEEEIVSVDSISGNTINIAQRGIQDIVLPSGEFANIKTPANPHDDESEVTSFYTLEGETIELALKILLSGGEDTALSPHSVNVGTSGSIQNAIFFSNPLFREEAGYQVGDTINIESLTNPLTSRLITAFGSNNDESWFIVDGANLVDETSFNGSLSIKSQYNVLPEGFGCKCRVDQVDINEFKRIESLFTSIFPYHFFYLTEEKTAQNFIDENLLFPSRLYSIPRKGKISIGITNPPLAGVDTLVLDHKNVTNPDKLEITRSINNYFYNSVIYKYNPDALENSKYLTQRRVLDAESVSRIKSGLKTLTINADGLRNTADNQGKVSDNIDRYLARYRFSAEPITVNALFGESFISEVGDTVFFGSEELQVGDIRQGSRKFQPRIMEIINKSLNISTGKVSMKLLDTNFASSGRYGVVSIASEITGGSSSALNIVPCFSETQTEAQRWNDFIGFNILVHSPDFTFAETVELTGFSGDGTMLTNPALSQAPQAGWIVTLAEYQDSDIILQSSFVFFDPRATITEVVSDNLLKVSATYLPYFSIGREIRIHDQEFIRDTGDVKVVGIIGDIIEYFNPDGFVPQVGDLIDLIGFQDGGDPYRLI